MTVPVTPQVLAAHVQNFLGQHGFPVRDFTLDGAPLDPHGPSSWAEGLARPGAVSLSQRAMAGVTSAAGRYGRRGRLSDDEILGLRTLLHEGVHQMRFGRTPDFYRTADEGGGYWEEAATEAVTQDLLPHLTRKLFGHRMPPQRRNASEVYVSTEPYARRLMQIRQMSTIGSGARHFNTWKARDWRRRFSHATAEDRDRMVAAVNAIRAGAS